VSEQRSFLSTTAKAYKDELISRDEAIRIIVAEYGVHSSGAGELLDSAVEDLGILEAHTGDE
jgi:hypothetical protein